MVVSHLELYHLPGSQFWGGVFDMLSCEAIYVSCLAQLERLDMLADDVFAYDWLYILICW